MNKVTDSDVIIRPIITEKSSRLMAEGIYVFEVDRRATRSRIKEAVERLFNVRVEKVNVMNVKPKPRRRGIYTGRTRSWKKAVVRLKEGYRISQLEGLH